MESGIYRLFWVNCNYFYYGQAKHLIRRKSIHYSNLRKNKHCNIKLQRIYKRLIKEKIKKRFNKTGQLPLF